MYLYKLLLIVISILFIQLIFAISIAIFAFVEPTQFTAAIEFRFNRNSSKKFKLESFLNSFEKFWNKNQNSFAVVLLNWLSVSKQKQQKLQKSVD